MSGNDQEARVLGKRGGRGKGPETDVCGMARTKRMDWPKTAKIAALPDSVAVLMVLSCASASDELAEKTPKKGDKEKPT